MYLISSKIWYIFISKEAEKVHEIKSKDKWQKLAKCTIGWILVSDISKWQLTQCSFLKDSNSEAEVLSDSYVP